jgi:hypothetical protein
MEFEPIDFIRLRLSGRRATKGRCVPHSVQPLPE